MAAALPAQCVCSRADSRTADHALHEISHALERRIALRHLAAGCDDHFARVVFELALEDHQLAAD